MVTFPNLSIIIGLSSTQKYGQQRSLDKCQSIPFLNKKIHFLKRKVALYKKENT